MQGREQGLRPGQWQGERRGGRGGQQWMGQGQDQGRVKRPTREREDMRGRTPSLPPQNVFFSMCGLSPVALSNVWKVPQRPRLDLYFVLPVLKRI